MRKKQKQLSSISQGLIILTLVNIVAVLGQTTCNNGVGRVLYERLPNQQLQGFDDDVVRDSAPPFRVLEKCQDLCLRDRTASNNLVRACTSFDFQPGSRIASFSGSAEYEESTCYLTREQPAPEGIGILMLVPNSVHFTEVCLSSSRPERECPSRRYVFERHPRKKLKLPVSDIKEITAANRSDCEDKCLNEFSFVCRSANFDSNLRSCTMSRFTRRTHPELLEDDPNSDYLENTCLNAERRCDGLAVYVKEENKRLGGPFEVDIFNNMTLEECQTMCIRAEKYFCRSVEFDDQSKQCVLSEEDSISQKDDISISSSPTHHFYDLVCLDNQRGNEYPDNSVTSHLFASGRRPDTAFQRYRNSRLGGEFHSEITGRSLSECLDECLRQTSFQCRSAVYSDRFRTCRLSRYNQRDGMRIIYDADYDYYENLMLGGDGDDRDRPSTRPDGTGTDWRPPYSGDRDRNKDRYPDDRYPSRYPPSDGQMSYDKYPTGSRPDYGDRYPAGGERYPAGGERYPAGGERYPPGGERYPPGGERYPAGGERYPPGGERYPAGGERYPAGGERYPGVGIGDEDRYPIIPDNRYPDDIRGGGGRPGIGGRYPDERYPVDDSDRGRFPGRYPSRYPDDRDRYPGMARPGIGGRYPDDRYPVDDRDNDRGRYPSRYPSNRFPDERYPIDDSDRGRYPGRYPVSSRYPDDSDYYAPSGRYPPDYVSGSRYPPDKDVSLGLPRPIPDDVRRPIGRPIAGRYPPDDRYPVDSRYPVDNRYPIDSQNPVDTRYPDRLRPTTSRYPIDMRYPIDSRYPDSRPGYSIPPDNRYPETRYPSPILSGGRYPVSENRFPVGNDRNPIYIYRYGNRERFPIGPGYDRYPMTAFDRERDRDRGYGDRFGGAGYGSPQEPGFDRGNGRPIYGGVIGGGYPPYEMPLRPPASGYDNSLNAGAGDGFGGFGPVRPVGGSRCDDNDNFKQIGIRQKVRRQYVRRVVAVPSLIHCQRECVDAKDFACRSFNYRDSALSYDTDGGSTASRERETANCELSDRDTRELDIQNPQMFDASTYDYYERSNSRNGVDGECLDVSQTCNEDGMEFTLRTPEGFLGRIYTYGFYDRCFFRGNAGTVNVLRISGSQGYPECGTQRYGDTMTNIVVVQFSDNVQTGRDKRFNLTCIFRGPGEAVVTSGYIGAGSGSPIPIEYLPAENTLSSKVRLMILYQNRPTTTIAVGDPLTFRLEAQDGYNQLTDIFATNVVARDPYSGRSIQLIDRYGCPVDPYVFPELDKLRSGDSLEARFNAFKIPESNFLVFEATVRTCREGCQPAYCPGQSGRSEPSFGRRRRSINGTLVVESTEELADTIWENENSTSAEKDGNGTATTKDKQIFDPDTSPDVPEHVREMIEVFETRDEIDNDIVPRKLVSPLNSICLTPSEYHGLISAVVLLMILLLSITLAAGLAYRRYWAVMIKNRSLDRSSPVNSFIPSALHQNMNVSSRQFNASTTGSSNQNMRPSLNLFNGSLQKTFATGNLSRMCQLPVMNPLRNNGNSSEFDDPSEPIYTDPSLFERSRSLRSIAAESDQD